MKALIAMVFVVVAACEQAPVVVTDEGTTQSTVSALRYEPATPEMVAAALTGDPEVMAKAVGISAACHAASTCPAQFASCASWSAFSSCGSSFCTGGCVIPPKCGPSDPDCEFSQRTGHTSNSFRVCFDAAQNACTEWRTQTTATGCGCGGIE
jgi:hypothetical protein